MHTISIADRGDREYRFECTCGTVGNWYGTYAAAQETGNAHKEFADGDPDRDKTNRKHTPHLGY